MCFIHARAGMKMLNLEQSSINFLKIYFDIVYYTLLSPFRIVTGWDAKTGRTTISLKKCWLQFILSVIFTFLLIIWHSRVAYLRIFSHVDFNRPGTFFEIAYQLVEFVEKLRILKQFWWNQQTIKLVLTHVIDADMEMETADYKQIPKWILLTSYLPHLFVALLGVVTRNGDFKFLRFSDWNLRDWWYSVKQMSRKVFLFQNGTSWDTMPCDDFSVGDTLIAVCGIIALLER